MPHAAASLSLTDPAAATNDPLARGWTEGYAATDDALILCDNRGDHFGLWRVTQPDDPVATPLWGAVAAEPATLSGHGRSVAFAPAAGPAGAGLFVGSSDGSRLRRVSESDRAAAHHSWVDPTHLVLADRRGAGTAIVLVDADSGSGVELVSAPAAELTAPHATDRDLVYVQAADGLTEVRRVDLDQGKRVETLIRGGRGTRPTMARPSPDGSMLACVLRAGTTTDLRVFHIGRRELSPPLVRGCVGQPRWSPDGAKIAITVDRWPVRSVEVIDVSSGQVRAIATDDAWTSCADGQWIDDDSLWVLANSFRAPGRVQRLDLADRLSLDPGPDPPEWQPTPQVMWVPVGEGVRLPCLRYLPPPRVDVVGTLLMLHGGPYGAWRSGWSPWQYLALRAGIEFVLVNTRGSALPTLGVPNLGPGEFGRVDVDDVLAVMSALRGHGGAQRGVALYGHSYGAYLAYQVAGRVPSAICGLIMSAGFLSPEDLDTSPDPQTRRFRAYAWPDPTPGPRRPPPVPTLMIHGEHDHAVPLATAQRNLSRLDPRRTTLLCLPGQGHAARSRSAMALWSSHALNFLDSCWR